MKITIDEPATNIQQIIIENIEKDEVPILESILELLDLQKDFYQVNKYYTYKCNVLTFFNRLRKNDD